MRSTFFVSFALLSASASLAACGSASSDAGSNVAPVIATDDAGAVDGGGGFDSSSSGDAGASQDGASANDAGSEDSSSSGSRGPWVVGPHPALPQITKGNGSVLTSPKVMAVYFDGYDYAAQVSDLAATLGAQPYWAAATHEYGVGPLTGLPAVQLHESPAANLTDAQIQSWLKSHLTGSSPALGTPDTQTIYTIFYPTSTTISQQHAKSCVQFGAYHNSLSVNGIEVPYAVVPECPTIRGQSGVDAVTVGASHEWIEASTDPYPSTNGAYNGIDDDHVAWGIVFSGVENGDMCATSDQGYAFLGGYTHKLQRGWSNAAALGDLDPCQPAYAPEPYFNAAPVMSDSVTVNLGGYTEVTTKGIKVGGVGQSATVPVQVWSLADVGDITLAAIDVTSAQNSGASPLLSFSWDKTTVHNGDTAHLTVTLKANPLFGQNAAFLIESTVGPKDDAGKHAKRNVWPGIVSP